MLLAANSSLVLLIFFSGAGQDRAMEVKVEKVS